MCLNNIDISQVLKDTENALRDFVASVLHKKFGDKWIDNSGVSGERISKWKERKETEMKRLESGVIEERLIYFADFYDLKTILEKHWNEFTSALGNWKTMEVWLNELQKLRDPDAHRRELLPHQKYLILGIGGEIRNRLIRFRSKQETPEDYFPKIESVRDSLGNIWTPESIFNMGVLGTKTILRPCDTIDFIITASDPYDEPLMYGMQLSSSDTITWQENTTFSITITNNHIGSNFFVRLCIKSKKPFHAKSSYDDEIVFAYTVLPTKDFIT